MHTAHRHALRRLGAIVLLLLALGAPPIASAKTFSPWGVTPGGVGLMNCVQTSIVPASAMIIPAAGPARAGR